MPNQFHINDFRIDIETGEIEKDEKIQVIEPKVMALLKVLAQKPRQVLAAETLFETVWPQAIYSPNSVRRNIAILRQALSDEDKHIIKTHPKRGYSLEAQIRFPDEKANVSSKKVKQKMYLKLTTLLTLTLILFSFYDSSRYTSLVNLKPITASNEQERYMQVSPDGRFMAYILNTTQPNKRKLLIKDLITGSHRELKTTLKAFTYLAWDTHTNALIYSFQDEEGISFSRLLLDEQAKVMNEERLFSRSDITWNSLFFIDEQQNLYYLANQNSSEHSRNVSLYRHNLVTGHIEKLLEPNEYFKPYKLALSPDQIQLALIGFNELAISEVKLLDLTSIDLISVGKVDHNWHFMDWFEDGKSLLLSNGSELKQLALNGELTKLNFKSFNFLIYPQIVKDKVYFIEAKSDQDILVSNLDDLSSPKKIINSNTVDKEAALSPDEMHIAYMSLKNGLPQLFIKHVETGEERLLFTNTKQEFALTKPIWHKSGKRITSSINNKPFIIQFDQNLFSTKWLNNVVGQPMAWYKKSDAILFVDKSTHNDELVKLDLKTNEITTLKTQLERKTIFLDHADELLSFANGQVMRHDSDEVLLGKDFMISGIYPNKNGFYYQYIHNHKSLIKFYDYERGVKTLRADFERFCVAFCTQITELSGNTILLKEQRQTADVLVLNID